MRNSVEECREEVRALGLTSDRDLVRQLEIKQEDKKKLFAWIKYQCAFAYQEGLREKQIKNKMVQIKQKKNGTYTLKIEGLEQKDLKVLQALIGGPDDKILKRLNKYQKDVNDIKIEEVPPFIEELFGEILPLRIYEEGGYE